MIPVSSKQPQTRLRFRPSGTCDLPEYGSSLVELDRSKMWTVEVPAIDVPSQSDVVTQRDPLGL
jgi:hypothetical protein